MRGFEMSICCRWDCYISFGWNWLNPIDDYRYVVGTMICIVCMAGMLSNAFVMYLSRADQEVAKNDYSELYKHLFIKYLHPAKQ